MERPFLRFEATLAFLQLLLPTAAKSLYSIQSARHIDTFATSRLMPGNGLLKILYDLWVDIHPVRNILFNKVQHRSRISDKSFRRVPGPASRDGWVP